MNTPSLCSLTSCPLRLFVLLLAGFTCLAPLSARAPVCHAAGYNLALRRQQHRHGRLQSGLRCCHSHHPERALLRRLRLAGKPLHLRHAEQLRAQGGHQRQYHHGGRTARQRRPGYLQYREPTRAPIPRGTAGAHRPGHRQLQHPLHRGQPAQLRTQPGQRRGRQLRRTSPHHGGRHMHHRHYRFRHACAHGPGGGQQLQPLHLHRRFVYCQSRSIRWCAISPATPATTICAVAGQLSPYAATHPLLRNYRHGHTRPPRRPCLRQERQPLHRRFKQQLRARDRRNDHPADRGWAMRQRPHRQFGHRPQQSLRTGILGGCSLFISESATSHNNVVSFNFGTNSLALIAGLPAAPPAPTTSRRTARLRRWSRSTSRWASPRTPAETSIWPTRRTTLCAGWAPTWPSRNKCRIDQRRTRPSSSASTRR